MKTIAFQGNRNITRALFVLAALGGLYYFRKQGGKMSDLVSKSGDMLTSARGFINRVAPSTSQSVATSAQI